MTTNQASAVTHHNRPDTSGYGSPAEAVRRVRLEIQQELDIARRLRREAQQYHRDMTARARSDAQQLVLKARLQTRQEVEQLVKQAREEVQKLIADIRIIRITAQEELAAQRKFTDAARLCSMTRSFMPQPDDAVPEPRKKPDNGR